VVWREADVSIARSVLQALKLGLLRLVRQVLTSSNAVLD